jgi:hypothetical protein
MFFPKNLLRTGMGLPEDPREARSARRKVWLLSVPTAVAWAVAGWSGALGILDGFRLMSLNRVSAWENSPGSMAALTVIFSISVTVASMLGFAMMWTDGRALGWPGSGSGAGRFATFLGLTIGTVVAVSSWTAPEAVGRRLPLSAGHPAEKWSDVDWIVYYEPYLVPAVFALVAVVTGALMLRAAWTAAMREDATGEIMHRGNRVAGRIEHVEFTHNWGMGSPQFRVRVSYQGTDGPRSVVTTMATSAFAAPLVGNTVDVLYDPDDDESIIVQARTDPSTRFPF